MKKLLCFLLVIPIIVFSQNSNFERTISISQFIVEMKEAGEKGDDFILKNCLITLDDFNTNKVHNQGQEVRNSDFNIDGVNFKYKSHFELVNCVFDNTPHSGSSIVSFTNCNFSTLKISSDSLSSNQKITFDSDTIDRLLVKNIYCSVNNSKIKFLEINGENEKYDNTAWIHSFSTYIISNNVINVLKISKVRTAQIKLNKLSSSIISGPIAGLFIEENIIEADLSHIIDIDQETENTFHLNNRAGIRIYNNIGYLSFENNIFYDLIDELSRNNILDSVNNNNYSTSRWSHRSWMEDDYEFNQIHKDFDNHLDDDYSYKPLISPEKIRILKSYIEEDDFIVITYNKFSGISVEGEINEFKMFKDSVHYLDIDCDITKLSIEKLSVRGYVSFDGTSFPNINNIFLDSSLNNIGFVHKHQVYSGNEDYSIVKSLNNDDDFIKSSNSVIVQYRELIRIFSARGSELLANTTYMMKSVLTTKKQYDYYLNPSIENWFNWKGNLFLKWYSDYGQNPFKALSYCFWTMIYFAGFYFFFYSDWDKINKQFLMSKFDSLILYFSSNKKLEDIYFKNDKTITASYVDFQTSIEKNKTFLPSFVILLAKPLYKFSLIRIYVRKRLFNSAEVLSERTWLELSKNKRVLFGFVTLIIIFLYTIYLILVRGFNSLILSINAFSTLGFGQIPVNGFTKYVAIIEGFVGWFFLSIFLVSLLNQMINI